MHYEKLFAWTFDQGTLCNNFFWDIRPRSILRIYRKKWYRFAFKLINTQSIGTHGMKTAQKIKNDPCLSPFQRKGVDDTDVQEGCALAMELRLSCLYPPRRQSFRYQKCLYWSWFLDILLLSIYVFIFVLLDANPRIQLIITSSLQYLPVVMRITITLVKSCIMIIYNLLTSCHVI